MLLLLLLMLLIVVVWGLMLVIWLLLRMGLLISIATECVFASIISSSVSSVAIISSARGCVWCAGEGRHGGICHVTFRRIRPQRKTGKRKTDGEEIDRDR